jgi:hypothetical protein
MATRRDMKTTPCSETRGSLKCKLMGIHEMHEDPKRGKWRHPKLPHGIKKPRQVQ